MKNYHNVVFLDKKPKKLSTEKSSKENARSGLRIGFFMAWYLPLQLTSLADD
jgi:hypothetical protein